MYNTYKKERQTQIVTILQIYEGAVALKDEPPLSSGQFKNVHSKDWHNENVSFGISAKKYSFELYL